nr:type II toxin-antitoxin system VapC family toxin [uncultured Dyadobacter sp.]
MKFLLDTHTLLWFIDGDSKMSHNARELIEDRRNEILTSVASLFEISIKLKIGKLLLEKSLDGFIRDVDKALIQVIPITNPHLLAYQKLPDIPDHRDPFDRLIIATACAESMTIITADPKFKNYSSHADIIW